MENQPLVSVGIPTYNRPEGLRRTLKCITQQTYKNLEIIVSDNCSPDPEVENVVIDFKENDGRIQYFRQSENFGAANNFKYVLEKATGEYFMWAADDDEWDERFIETCILNIGKNGSIMCNYTCLFRTSGERQKTTLPVLSEKNSTYENLLSFVKNIQPSMFYGLHKRDTILTFLHEDYYDFYDCFFVFRQILNHGFITINEYLYTAGIDSDKYIPKPFIKQNNKLFQYKPFFTHVFQVILRTNKLKFKHKVLLIHNFTNVILGLFISHEVKKRPYQVKIVKLFLYGFNIKARIIKKIKHRFSR